MADASWSDLGNEIRTAAGGRGALSIHRFFVRYYGIFYFEMLYCGIVLVCGIRRLWPTVYGEIQISLAYFGVFQNITTVVSNFNILRYIFDAVLRYHLPPGLQPGLPLPTRINCLKGMTSIVTLTYTE